MPTWAVSLDPTNADAYYSRGWLRRKRVATMKRLQIMVKQFDWIKRVGAYIGRGVSHLRKDTRTKRQLPTLHRSNPARPKI